MADLKPPRSERAQQVVNNDLELLAELIDDQPAALAAPNTKSVKIEDEIARSQKIKNDDAEQDIALKKVTLERLFALLYSETVAVFLFALMQSTRLFNFHMEEWSFKLLISVTIAQITAMLFVAVNYLFPKKQA